MMNWPTRDDGRSDHCEGGSELHPNPCFLLKGTSTTNIAQHVQSTARKNNTLPDIMDGAVQQHAAKQLRPLVRKQFHMPLRTNTTKFYKGYHRAQRSQALAPRHWPFLTISGRGIGSNKKE